jgi:hypothetical protein
MKLPLSLVATLFLSVHAASAQVLAYEEAGVSSDTAATGLVGFNFTVDSPLEVTHLGFYGVSMGGADTPWVALYDVANGGTPLASITSFAPTNGWQYIALGSPVTLTVGVTYQVVATAYWSPRYADTSSFDYGAEINPVGFTAPNGWGGWGTPVMATNAVGTAANITGNLQYEAIPEPAGVLLAGAGVGVLLFRRRVRA